MYLRQNGTQEFLGDMKGVSQPTVSRIVTVLVPVVRAVLEEFVPSAEDAIQMASGRVCLVDGTITPCWSYEEHRELWSRKHGTTGFNAQLVSLLSGNAIYISDPLPGKTHDAAAFASTPVAEIIRNSGGGIADKGYQGWRHGHPAQEAAARQALAMGKAIQRSCLIAPGTHRKARCPFQVLADLPHGLPPPVPYLPRRV